VLVPLRDLVQETRHPARVIAHLVGERDPDLIGIFLVITIELVLEQVLVDTVSVGSDELLRQGATRRASCGGVYADSGESPLLDSLGGMPLRYVGDLVAEHTCQFRLSLHQAERSPGDVDQPARGGIGIHAFGVEDDELPLEAWTRAGLRQHGAEERDVLANRLVLIDTETLD